MEGPTTTTSTLPICKSSKDVLDYLIGRVDELYSQQPEHPIFGPTAHSLVRAPYSSPRTNGVTWSRIFTNLTNRQFLIPPTIGYNCCWMFRGDTSLKLMAKNAEGNSVHARSVKYVRVIAFFVDPTPVHWAALQLGDESVPFDHECRRGEFSDEQPDYQCINAVEHGHFSSRYINENRKNCTFGAACLCPGHTSPYKCIFTAPDGVSRPCLNNPDSVPSCAHSPRCY
jgi:hypothetical protein